jgi:hypothetical protein
VLYLFPRSSPQPPLCRWGLEGRPDRPLPCTGMHQPEGAREGQGHGQPSPPRNETATIRVAVRAGGSWSCTAMGMLAAVGVALAKMAHVLIRARRTYQLWISSLCAAMPPYSFPGSLSS